jgi:hypothetical protein
MVGLLADAKNGDEKIRGVFGIKRGEYLPK